ncbi:hypothetical protein, partial [Luteimonas sp. TWI1416]|uniref:hypothetical protein n=1 Tax=unclassified Luteimonas TaxID=2629088 RepID=UPI00320AE08E
ALDLKHCALFRAQVAVLFSHRDTLHSAGCCTWKLSLPSSHATQRGSAMYRQETAEMIANGDYRDAMAREVRDVRRAAYEMSGDRTKYNQAMREMLEYARESGQLPARKPRK